MNSIPYTDSNGTIVWRRLQSFVIHRENGPAVERRDGYKEWCINGRLHREDGPAVICPSPPHLVQHLYYLDGEHILEKDFPQKLFEYQLTRIIET